MRHGVDLDRLEPGGLGGGEPAQDVGVAVAQRQLEEALGPQRVEADVDPAQPGGAQRLGLPLEADAVGGERQREVEARQPLDEPGQPAAQQRLAAGEPDGAHAHRGEDPDQPDQLVVGEQLRLGQPVEALRRHAVGAAQVAAVGQRQAQVRVDPAEAVDQRRPHGFTVRARPDTGGPVRPAGPGQAP
jgi:hypothetical protein